MAAVLRSLGYSVVLASRAREGLAQLEAGEAVDLVLTDLKMPEMSGWEVVKSVKARWPHLPVGVITGTPEASGEGREVVDVVIAKPIGLDALRDAIRRVLR